MLRHIIFGVTVLIWVTRAARLDSSYVPPAQNSINSCEVSYRHKEYQPSHSQQYQPNNIRQQQYQTSYSQKPQGQQIPILKYENNNPGDGSYNFAYETGNGIKHQEQGSQNPEQVVVGSYSYTDSDGNDYTVNYKADENGFVATGDHLPTPPPIPPEIQESLKLTAPGYNPYKSGSSPIHSSAGYSSQQQHHQSNSQSYNQPQYQFQQQQQQHASTNFKPGVTATQVTHSSGNPGGTAVFASQSSFSPGGAQQTSYSQQGSFRSPTNKYLPPF